MTTVSETAATLRFKGDDLDPAELSRLLGAESTAQHRKGDRRIIKDVDRGSWPSASWVLTTTRAMPGNLDSQILTIFERLTIDIEIWQDLSKRFDGELFVGLFLVEGNEGITLSARTLSEVASRGLRLDFDIYGPPGSK